MPWIKDADSQAPKIIYTAPEGVYPIERVIYDPNAINKWAIEYAWLSGVDDTVESIENLMEF